MSIINCIEPIFILDQHLGSEHSTICKLLEIVHSKTIQQLDNAILSAPEFYTIGAGRQKFFYDKLLYLHQREAALAKEYYRRFPSRKQLKNTKPKIKYHEYMLDWEPTPQAIALNQQQLTNSSVNLRKRTYQGVQVSVEQYLETLQEYNSVETNIALYMLLTNTED